MLGAKKVKVNGVAFEIKKVTPEDFLDKTGVPISKWENEIKRISDIQNEGSVTLSEIKKTWKRVFSKSIISIDNKTDDLESLIDTLIENYELSNELFDHIIKYTYSVKKKNILLNLFQKNRQ